MRKFMYGRVRNTIAFEIDTRDAHKQHQFVVWIEIRYKSFSNMFLYIFLVTSAAVNIPSFSPLEEPPGSDGTRTVQEYLVSFLRVTPEFEKRKNRILGEVLPRTTLSVAQG